MLDKLEIQPKLGNELFHSHGQGLEFNLLSFWQWVDSDLVNNSCRGKLAEYLVAQALGIDTNVIRSEWTSFDLQLPSGKNIEVKSAAYIQSWGQNKLSSISFKISKTLAWDPATNQYSKDFMWQADIYIFALLSHEDKISIDPLDVSQWKFYVLPPSVINTSKQSKLSFTLTSLEKLCQACTYFELAKIVGEVSDV